MYVVQCGWDFDSSGYPIPNKEKFSTLEEANAFVDMVWEIDGTILAIEKE